jgi:hypothetical protein
MGVICEEVTGRTCVLEAHHLIGRSHRCSLQLTELSVSGEHASLRWTGRAWVLKDLGSRYGTFLNSQCLQPGVAVDMKKGDRLAFGREKRTWLMTEESSPQVMVVPAEGGPAIFQHDGLIAMPSIDRPDAVIFQDMEGRWVLDQAGQVDLIKEHVPFLFGGTRWRLCNASPLQPTSLAAGSSEGRETMALGETMLHFAVSRSEEHVEITARWRGRVIEMGARSHHYVLLTLARVRLRDIERGEQTTRAGWIDQGELLKQLALGPEKLNLDIFRARRQFGAAGFIPAAGIVERRPATRELRLGVAEIDLEMV